jgi:hypothetical protein
MEFKILWSQQSKAILPLILPSKSTQHVLAEGIIKSLPISGLSEVNVKTNAEVDLLIAKAEEELARLNTERVKVIDRPKK